MLFVWTLSVLSYRVLFSEWPTPQVLSWVFGLVLLFSLSSNIDAGQVAFKAFRVGRVVVMRNTCLVLLPFQLFYLYQCALLVVSSGGLANYLPEVRAAALSGT